jgi:membrane-bound lytic murein transglycosylase MltF
VWCPAKGHNNEFHRAQDVIAPVLAGAPTVTTAHRQKFSSEELNRRMLEWRAVEAVIWGRPIVSLHAMRRAYFRDRKAKHGNVIWWPKGNAWKNQSLTINTNVRNLHLFLNKTERPVVLDLPQAANGSSLLGTIVDASQVPLMDVGFEGEGWKIPDSSAGLHGRSTGCGRITMFPRIAPRRRSVGLVQLFALLLLIALSRMARESHAQSVPTSPASNQASLPLNFERHTGDLDEMEKRNTIRALVLYSHTGFFYVDGRPEGIYYEALRAFEQFVNQKLPASKQHVQVTFIPVRPDQIESALTQGVGDLIAFGLVVTPERQQKVAFSIPIQRDIQQIVVMSKNLGPVSSFDDLGGKKVFVNPLTTYPANLEKINDTLRKQGKLPILIEAADKSLMDEDLLQMVNAGLIPATVTTTERANLWSPVLKNIIPYPKLGIGNEGQLAWAMRKNNPQLKELLDEFIKTRVVGTSFGNTLVRRYLQNDQFVKNATSEAEIKKFNETVAYFKKYSSQYGFDYLMIVAQGYQESMLKQSARSPGGAVGIMQVKPRIAAAAPISIPDITTADNNIHAGVKVLKDISDNYFNDPEIDPMNRLLFTFAGYNAGPSRIAGLRKEAPAAGLDPNKWFGNVELLVAQGVGPVTVQYVSNIYKYYVAYKLVVDQGQSLR